MPAGVAHLGTETPWGLVPQGLLFTLPQKSRKFSEP